jgi:WD40 repeat protein
LENTRTVLRELDAADSTKMKTFEMQYPTKEYGEERTMKDMKTSKQAKSNKLAYVGPNEQGCVTRWCEDIKLNRIERVETDHTDSILCIHFVGDKYIVTGSKDHTINVYSLDGKKIRYLKGHQAAICCLAFVKGPSGDLLASGSDNGCGSVILWDTKSWQSTSKIQAHEAAVTSIVDL